MIVPTQQTYWTLQLIVNTFISLVTFTWSEKNKEIIVVIQIVGWLQNRSCKSDAKFFTLNIICGPVNYEFKNKRNECALVLKKCDIGWQTYNLEIVHSPRAFATIRFRKSSITRTVSILSYEQLLLEFKRHAIWKSIENARTTREMLIHTMRILVEEWKKTRRRKATHHRFTFQNLFAWRL